MYRPSRWKRCEVAADGRTDSDSERRAPLVRPLSRGDGQVALPLALLVVALLHQTGHVLEQGLWRQQGQYSSHSRGKV